MVDTLLSSISRTSADAADIRRIAGGGDGSSVLGGVTGSVVNSVNGLSGAVILAPSPTPQMWSPSFRVPFSALTQNFRTAFDHVFGSAVAPGAGQTKIASATDLTNNGWAAYAGAKINGQLEETQALSATANYNFLTDRLNLVSTLDGGQSTALTLTQATGINLAMARPYNNATAYSPGHVVIQAGVYYTCILSSTGNTPPNATYWTVFTGWTVAGLGLTNTNQTQVGQLVAVPGGGTGYVASIPTPGGIGTGKVHINHWSTSWFGPFGAPVLAWLNCFVLVPGGNGGSVTLDGTHTQITYSAGVPAGVVAGMSISICPFFSGQDNNVHPGYWSNNSNTGHNAARVQSVAGNTVTLTAALSNGMEGYVTTTGYASLYSPSVRSGAIIQNATMPMPGDPGVTAVAYELTFSQRQHGYRAASTAGNSLASFQAIVSASPTIPMGNWTAHWLYGLSGGTGVYYDQAAGSLQGNDTSEVDMWEGYINAGSNGQLDATCVPSNILVPWQPFGLSATGGLPACNIFQPSTNNYPFGGSTPYGWNPYATLDLADGNQHKSAVIFTKDSVFIFIDDVCIRWANNWAWTAPVPAGVIIDHFCGSYSSQTNSMLFPFTSGQFPYPLSIIRERCLVM